MCVFLTDDQSIVRLDRDWNAYRKDQQPIGPPISEVPTVYVNANYVKACGYDVLGQAAVAPKKSLPAYIATQGPLTHTEADFLYMVHQQHSPAVIMLCNNEEGGKAKCAQYWPTAVDVPEEKRSQTRTVTVTLSEANSSPFMVTRVLTVQPEGKSMSWTFTQLHFLGWSGHVLPSNEEFYQFLQAYNRLRNEKPLSNAFGPTIVHCSAGVGRTGTLICADMLLNQLRKKPSQIDVSGTILASRVFRRNLVQTEDLHRGCFSLLAFHPRLRTGMGMVVMLEQSLDEFAILRLNRTCLQDSVATVPVSCGSPSFLNTFTTGSSGK
ncbi:unnamed protein product [Dibothriocephalus latus]|uniref:Tyrosine-protein phosphatase domain-containing protein n=1 Tax=Dibothriocephalus latus TaxID=60516 RepID=A0A3P7L6X6_DIBLA|nr:unnamed protein product [Dibothriocephalus latus]